MGRWPGGECLSDRSPQTRPSAISRASLRQMHRQWRLTPRWARMIRVRLRRALAVLATVFVAVWLVPSRADAAGTRHHGKRTYVSQATCLGLGQPDVFGSEHSTRLTHGDDVADDFDDRDDRTDPTSTPTAHDGAASESEPVLALPWARTGRAAEPRAAQSAMWRRVAAPRPPPSR